MRADLPLCDFKNCKYQFDGNCTDEKRHDECDYEKLYQRCIDINRIAKDTLNMIEQFKTTKLNLC